MGLLARQRTACGRNPNGQRGYQWFFLASVAHALLYAGSKTVGDVGSILRNWVAWLTTPFWFLDCTSDHDGLALYCSTCCVMVLCFLVLGTDPEQKVVQYRVKRRRRDVYFSGAAALFALLLLCTLPQILYLVSRNITPLTLHAPHGFNWPLDVCLQDPVEAIASLPGNEACHHVAPVNTAPATAAISHIMEPGAGCHIVHSPGECRKHSLDFLVNWVLIALSAMRTQAARK